MLAFTKSGSSGQGTSGRLGANSAIWAVLAVALLLPSSILAQTTLAPNKTEATSTTLTPARTWAGPNSVRPTSATKNQAKFSQAPSPVTAKVLPPRRPRVVVDSDYEYQAPDSYCAPTPTYYSSESDSPAIGSQPQLDDSGRVESMDRVQEIPDERVQSMPRIGEN